MKTLLVSILLTLSFNSLANGTDLCEKLNNSLEGTHISENSINGMVRTIVQEIEKIDENEFSITMRLLSGFAIKRDIRVGLEVREDGNCYLYNTFDAEINADMKVLSATVSGSKLIKASLSNGQGISSTLTER